MQIFKSDNKITCPFSLNYVKTVVQIFWSCHYPMVTTLGMILASDDKVQDFWMRR